MSFSAIIPADQLDAANAALDAQGFGPSNFSVPVYDNARPGYATCHAWTDPAFQAAVEAIPGVTVSSIEGSPQDRVADAISQVSATASWGSNAPPLEGQVTPGLHKEADGELWWVIQAYDTATYPDPLAVPAIVRKARTPGVAEPWQQPLDQFDAYLLEDPFTGQPEEALHNGKRWRVNEADASGLNSWEPGVFGWIEIGEDGNPVEPPEEPGGGDEWQTGVSYSVGDVVTYEGAEYECIQAHTSQAGWQPPNVPALWSLV
jgi:hypothetical protein